MFDIVLDYIKNIVKSRLFPLTIIFMALFGILINRLFVYQIVEGQDSIENQIYRTEKNRELKSTRGNIYDRNGVLLAYNVLSYGVQIEDTGELTTNLEKNGMIHKLINILEENGSEIAYEFYITLNQYNQLEFTVSDNALLRFKKNAYGHKYVSDLTEEQIDATADDVFLYLKKGSGNTTMFNISDDYTTEEALKIMTIRYALYMNSYQKYLPVTIARDINQVTVAAISENKSILRGVEIIQETNRQYNESLYFSHIIGYTGLIPADELETKNAENADYTITDTIGRDGIEKVFEEYLRGNKGHETVMVNSMGRVLEIKERIEPQAGNDLYLTIDSQMQQTYYKILEKNIATIVLSNITTGTSKDGKNMYIPINDVYFALIDNNIISTKDLNSEIATDLEKSVYEKFVTKQKEVLESLKNLLQSDNIVKVSTLNEEMQGYIEYVYTMLGNQGIIIKGNINTEDTKYIAYKNNEISISEYLQYAISVNWIDIAKLEIGETYYSTEELYELLSQYIIKVLTGDNSFNKLLYKKMIYESKLTGREICLLLYDQEILEYDKEERDKLANGTVSSYNFIRSKIENLEITPADLALDPCSGSLIVTDVNTGDILALVSYPSFDNNNMNWSKLLNDKTSPLLNRTTYSRTAPGSTYKMVVSVTGLEEGTVSTTDVIKDEGSFEKVFPPAKCWAYPATTHGHVNVAHALEVSCNFFYYELGYRLSMDSTGKFSNAIGLNKIAKYATMFGLDRKSGIELSEYEPRISDDSSVRSAIGQGTNSFTPAQIARYITTIANRGTCYDLTLLDKVIDLNGKVVLENKAKVANTVDIQQSSWNAVHEGMYLVANGAQGTIRNIFKDLEVSVAAKTGTAQEDSSRPNHALCVAYAPYDNPEIAITVVIPNGYASGNAAEVVCDVAKSYFKLETEEEILSNIGQTGHSNTIGD